MISKKNGAVNLSQIKKKQKTDAAVLGNKAIPLSFFLKIR